MPNLVRCQKGSCLEKDGDGDGDGDGKGGDDDVSAVIHDGEIVNECQEY